MNRTEIRELADKARNGDAKALREFKALALYNGFVGRPGGWIYFGDSAAIVQGWQGLADFVFYGQETFAKTLAEDEQMQAAAEAETELTEADDAPAATTTYLGKTAAEWRAEAQAARQRSADSWERSDTDGFLSQWASDTMARKYDACAELADLGGVIEFQVPFVNGEVATAELDKDGQYGRYWYLTVEAARVVGKRYFTPSSANKAATRRKNNAKKGVTMGTILIAADVELVGGRYSCGPAFVPRELDLRNGDFEVVSVDDDSTDY